MGSLEFTVETATALRQAAAMADPEQAFAFVLSTLVDIGLAEPTGEVWFTVAHRGRTIQLNSNLTVDVVTRTLLAGLIESVLTRALEHQEHRYLRERMEMISAGSFEGILIHVDGVVIDANQRLAEILGCDYVDLLGDRTLRECVAPEDLPVVLQRMANKTEGEYLITGIRKDGSTFRAELLSKQGHLGDRPVRVVAVRDVTTRERTSMLLRESETQLRSLTDQVFDVVVLSREGVVIDVRGKVEQMLGYSADQLIGRKLTDFVALSSLEVAKQVIAEQRVGSFESTLLDIAGEKVPVEIVGVRSTLHGEPIRVAGLRDLREQRRLEAERHMLQKQLERSQRMDSLGVLASGIAHDFNNLLVGILGNAELLERRLEDPKLLRYAQSIRAAGQRAAGLTKQMLVYAGQRDVGQREPIELGALWLDLRALLDAALSKKARVELSLAPDSIVLGERATLTQVLMNLLTNASDALGDSPGYIHIRTSKIIEPDIRWRQAIGNTVSNNSNGWILLEVRDSGVGMDEATKERIFEPFFSTKEKGHGLGLAACLGIVAAHGGAILVESELGKGTCFSVLLPASEQRVAVVPTHLPTQMSNKPYKILIVDDEVLVRRSLRHALESMNYQVEEANNGESGIVAVFEVKPDILLLDMTMPDLSGPEVVRRIRERGGLLPIVVSSGYSRSSPPGNIQGFLPKPYSIDNLARVLNAALSSAKPTANPIE